MKKWCWPASAPETFSIITSIKPMACDARTSPMFMPKLAKVKPSVLYAGAGSCIESQHEMASRRIRGRRNCGDDGGVAGWGEPGLVSRQDRRRPESGREELALHPEPER